MRPAAGAAPARPGPAAKKKKKMKKTVKQLQPRAEEAAAERAAAEQAAEEAARRARHLKELCRASGAERELEELVFGDSINVEEEELLQRLAGPPRVGARGTAGGSCPAAFPEARAPPTGGARGGGAVCGPEEGPVLRLLVPARSPPLWVSTARSHPWLG